MSRQSTGVGDGRWLGRELILEVDHIDGDFYNNEISNLRFLCPNCHRQTPNHAGRSAGKYVRSHLEMGCDEEG